MIISGKITLVTPAKSPWNAKMISEGPGLLKCKILFMMNTEKLFSAEVRVLLRPYVFSLLRHSPAFTLKVNP